MIKIILKNIKIVLSLLFLLVSFSSCRPRYMRCPKNKRCVEITKTQLSKNLIVTNYKKEFIPYQLDYFC